MPAPFVKVQLVQAGVTTVTLYVLPEATLVGKTKDPSPFTVTLSAPFLSVAERPCSPAIVPLTVKLVVAVEPVGDVVPDPGGVVVIDGDELLPPQPASERTIDAARRLERSPFAEAKR